MRPALAAWLLALLAAFPSPAAQPPGVLEKDLVRVVFQDPGLRDAAARVADTIPGLVREQAAELGVTAPDRVTVSLVSRNPRNADDARALGIGGMPRWAAGMARAGSSFIAVRLDRLGRYPDRSLTAVLAHEVAHLMLDRALGIDRATEVPAWFDEGYAMTEAARYTGGHRWQLGRSLVVSGPIPLERLERRWPDDGPGARSAYAQVHSFFSYVLDKAGDGAARRVIRAMRDGERFRFAWRDATGRAPEDWARAWRSSVTFWYRWIPLLTSGGTVWLVASLLFLTAYARRRRRNRLILDRWEAEERFEDDGPDERWRGPVA